MSDWQIGDLALCVSARPNPYSGDANPCKAGQVYTVARVLITTSGTVGLGLVGITFPNCNLNAEVASRFRKILPDKHEPCEAEFITLLKRGKVKA